MHTDQNEFKLIFKHLDIAWSLAKRELKGRYRGSWLGFLWTLMDPLIMMAIFYFIFAVVFQRDYPHYLLYLMSGLLPYFFLNQGLLKATNCMTTYGPLIRQIYCPRQLFVAVGILSELYHFCLALVALVPLYIYYGFVPDLRALWIIPVTLMLALLILGLGLITSVINVFFRDMGFLVSHILRMWFYITPVFYNIHAVKSIPDKLMFFYRLNPLVPILEIYRWALMQREPAPDPRFIGIAAIQVLVFLVVGLLIFHRLDNSMVKML